MKAAINVPTNEMSPIAVYLECFNFSAERIMVYGARFNRFFILSFKDSELSHLDLKTQHAFVSNWKLFQPYR